MRRQGLVTAENTVAETGLFWRLAERWSTPRIHLATPPNATDTTIAGPLRLGLDDLDHGAGWALTDSAAAAAYGAPVALRDRQVLDFLVPDQSVIRRAQTLLGCAPSAADARATVRVAPVPAAVQRRVAIETNPLQWPLAHPVFVALDLAQDSGRGRDILNDWTPKGRWTRVW